MNYFIKDFNIQNNQKILSIKKFKTSLYYKILKAKLILKYIA